MRARCIAIFGTASDVALLKVITRNGKFVDETDGSVSGPENVMGTYMHGFFDTPAILEKWLLRVGITDVSVSAVSGIEAQNRQYDRLATHIRENIDLAFLFRKES